jgi:hypothetical protein
MNRFFDDQINHQKIRLRHILWRAKRFIPHVHAVVRDEQITSVDGIHYYYLYSTKEKS